MTVVVRPRSSKASARVRRRRTALGSFSRRCTSSKRRRTRASAAIAATAGPSVGEEPLLLTTCWDPRPCRLLLRHRWRTSLQVRHPYRGRLAARGYLPHHRSRVQRPRPENPTGSSPEARAVVALGQALLRLQQQQPHVLVVLPVGLTLSTTETTERDLARWRGRRWRRPRRPGLLKLPSLSEKKAAEAEGTTPKRSRSGEIAPREARSPPRTNGEALPLPARTAGRVNTPQDRRPLRTVTKKPQPGMML